MSELDKLKKQRTVARGNLTKARNALEKVIVSEESDKLDLQESIEDLNKHLQTVVTYKTKKNPSSRKRI